MDRKVSLSQSQKELIEKFGVHMERTGLTPAESRLIALLGISDITELTFDEISQSLQLSKGATSNAINRLLEMKRIHYITKPGDRKRYFHLDLGNWEKKSQEKLQEFSLIGDVWREILQNRTPDTPEFNKNLARLIDFLKFIEKELPILFEKWRKQNP